jgi:hypothetical protein
MFSGARGGGVNGDGRRDGGFSDILAAGGERVRGGEESEVSRWRVQFRAEVIWYCVVLIVVANFVEMAIDGLI